LRPAGTSLLLFALAGCATRAQVVQQDRQYRGMLQDQRRQLQELQHEVERLRADIEEGHSGKGGAGSANGDRLAALEQRVSQLEGGTRSAAPPAAEAAVEPPRPAPPTAPPAPAQPATTPSPATAPPGAPPAATSADDEWRRELAREQASAGAVNVPERAEYLGLLDGLARQDCTRAVPQLNSFAASHKESPLADNALYWAARCYQQKGRQEEAISKFYEVGTKYPKGDKAAAALWAQGNLFLQMGNSPDARIVFSKLIRDYPGSDEASRARQKLTQLEN
ncbi:MAG TPA: tetratricopeptide repeat protein, partial [Myxococcales bacterium]|nr:tetratricopeptide repeat protein [Myxococcales bacterium]